MEVREEGIFTIYFRSNSNFFRLLGQGFLSYFMLRNGLTPTFDRGNEGVTAFLSAFLQTAMVAPGA
jgi:hypothetical protein